MKITKALIDNYLNGTANAEEIAAVETAVANNELNWEDFMPEKEWNRSGLHGAFEKQSEIKAQILKQIEPKNNYRFYWIKYAAIILFVGIGAWLALTQIKSPKTVTAHLTPKRDNTSKNLEQPSNLYYINSGNNVQQIDVSDGSVIELYPNSEVKFTADFSGISAREIQLKGKATFIVAKDKTKPFRVYTASLTTTALGTIFSVDESSASITKIKLYEGRIEVKSDNNHQNIKPLNLQFQPNEEISFDRKQQQIVAETRVNTSLASKRGSYQKTDEQLIFNNLSLHDVLHIISHNYAIKLNFAPRDIQDKYYSGTYKNTKSAYINILADIQALHRITITVKTE